MPCAPRGRLPRALPAAGRASPNRGRTGNGTPTGPTARRVRGSSGLRTPCRSPAARAWRAHGCRRPARAGRRRRRRYPPPPRQRGPRRSGTSPVPRGRFRTAAAGGRPSCPSSPPIPCAARLLCSPASTTSVRRLARPSTSAALSPAAPPPTTTQSHSLSMKPTLPNTAGSANIFCHGGKEHGRRRPPGQAQAARTAHPARPDAGGGRHPGRHRRVDAQPPGVGQAQAGAGSPAAVGVRPLGDAPTTCCAHPRQRIRG